MRKDDPSSTDDQPRSPSRRALFHGAALAGSAALIGTLPRQAAATETTAEAIDPALETVPFYGKRQSGITNPIPAAGLMAAFNVLATNRNELSQLFQILTERFAFLTQGGPGAKVRPHRRQPLRRSLRDETHCRRPSPRRRAGCLRQPILS